MCAKRFSSIRPTDRCLACGSSVRGPVAPYNARGPEMPEIPSRVAPREQLPEPLGAYQLLCRVCRNGLLYKRQERPRYPRQFLYTASDVLRELAQNEYAAGGRSSAAGVGYLILQADGTV